MKVYPAPIVGDRILSRPIVKKKKKKENPNLRIL